MAIYMMREFIIPDYLCFTAEQTNSTVKLTTEWTSWSPTVVSLETSTDWTTWTNYTIWDTITLSSVWDKVYWRNKSETATGFSISSVSYYRFIMTWRIAWGWDINYLLCKNSTDTVAGYYFYRLFRDSDALVSSPKLTATTLTWRANYSQMFYWCDNLETLPELPATTLSQECYYRMFYNCSKIKLSSTQTWDYQTPYRIPTTWTWTTANNAMYQMFTYTWGSSAWTPTINTTYYTSNTVV